MTSAPDPPPGDDLRLRPASDDDWAMVRRWLRLPAVEKWCGPPSTTEAAVIHAFGAAHSIARIIERCGARAAPSVVSQERHLPGALVAVRLRAVVVMWAGSFHGQAAGDRRPGTGGRTADRCDRPLRLGGEVRLAE